jgi:acyl CoA:acetate/3-ketoacid CoA transferase beta subunit
MRWATTSSLADGSLPAAVGHVRHVDVDEDTLTLLPALRPDVTFVHAAIADQRGNAVICPPYTENTLGALAARRGAIVTVERIVSDEEFRRHSHLPVIPALAVLAVCAAPLGSHPAGLFADGIDPSLTYADDYAYLSEMLTALEEDEDARTRWIEEHVVTKADPADYQRSLPSGRVEHLRTWWRKDATVGPAPVTVPVSDMPANPTERMVVLAARVLLSAADTATPEYLFAGIGTSSLAAWLANALSDAEFPLLVSETGLLGYQPSVGDPWLFSAANISSATGLTDTESILGALIQGRGDKGMSVLAAAQVDAAGDINSTRAGGRFLTGSGGANDVLSGCRDVTVLIPHRGRRLVAEVDYVTSPGRAVRRIVTDRAVLTRDGDRFVLSAVLADPARPDPDELVADIVAATPWPCLGEHPPEIVPPPSDAELRVLRGLDPLGLFLDTTRPGPVEKVSHT